MGAGEAMPGRIVVVGGGLAGLRTIEELRSLGYAGEITLIGAEANSVTDNPIILLAWRHSGIDHLDQYHGKYDGKYVEVVSGGHFHGMPIAVDAYGLIQAASIIARLSNMRCVRFVDTDKNKGLGADLKWPGGRAGS